MQTVIPELEPTTVPMKRARELFSQYQHAAYRRTDHLFAYLMGVQWLAGIVAALVISPRAWSGAESQIHWHVWAAVFLGGLVSGFPIFLVLRHPGEAMTRQAVAVGQMLMSALLIHLTGGRIETHFHIFGSLAFLAFYRDWRVIVTATIAVVIDHVLRGIYWPQSIFGVLASSHWRWIEHAGWVLFEDVFLLIAIRYSTREMFAVAAQRARLEVVNDEIEHKVDERTRELTLAQRDLRKSEELFRLITQNAVDLIAVLDANGEILYSSPSYEKALGQDGQGLVGIRLVDRVHSDDLAAAEEAIRVCAESGAERSLEYRMKHPDGTWRSYEAQSTRGKDAASGDPYLVVVSRDVTERKRAEKERQQIELQLRHGQKLESIGQLAAGIAHEINTPTQFISDNTRFLKEAFEDINRVLTDYGRLLDVIRKGGLHATEVQSMEKAVATADVPYLAAEIPKAIQQSLEGLDRVARIVRAMKDFSHPGSVEKVAFDLNQAIESTAIIAKNEWKYVADLVMELDPSLPSVPCLPGEFNQVILNLIVNASHAIIDKIGKTSPSKGKITLSTKHVPGWAEVRISDTGTGIPEQYRERIFDPFFTTKEVGRGTGQGLSIAHSVIVERHGGTIGFETEIGQGTTFIVRLPLQREPSVISN